MKGVLHIRGRITALLLLRPAIGLTALLLLLPVATLTAQQPDPPEWSRGVVWYLMMPDRFHNGDTLNDPDAAWVFNDPSIPWEVSEWTANWYDLTVQESMLHEGFYPAAFLRQYGGDLIGAREKLDYLAELGVSGIILTPVFEAGSAHKFDVRSYHHVDPHFGPKTPVDTALLAREVPEDPRTWYLTAADREFVDFIAAAHERGMRVLLTTQFAHVSVDFWAFKNVLEHQETSRYGSWFTIRQWDRPETPYDSEFDYDRMWGIDAFPRLRQDTLGLVSGPREYVFASTTRWMDPNGDGDPSDGVDGWCVDLSQELPQAFWEEWTRHCRTLNPDALIVNLGEGRGPTAAPFDMDRTKDFGRSVTSFLLDRRLSSTEFDSRTQAQRSRTTLAGSDMQLNMMNSHETDRLASMCVNDSLPYDVQNSPRVNPAYRVRPPNTDESALQRMLLLLQFTLPGSPVIYYGDEAGMWGGDDPDNRKPMVWPEMRFAPERSFAVTGDDTAYPVRFDSSLFGYYRRLIEFRRQYTALSTGSMQTLLIDDVAGLYVFMRAAGAEKVYVAVNASDRPQVCVLRYLDLPEGIRLRDPIHGVAFYTRRDQVSFVLPPRAATLLIPQM